MDDGTAPPFPALRLRVSPIDVHPDHVLAAWAAPRDQALKSDWSFRIANIDGQYLFRVAGLPDEWALKAVVLGGRDVTDAPLNIIKGSADIEGLQIVVSRTAAKLTGEIVDQSGAPTADATVMLFAENRTLWGVGSRFVRAVRPDKSGRFAISGMPPAVYRAIARDFVTDGQWEDPEFLQRALKDATRVELKEAAAETIKLTLVEAR